MSKLPKYYPLLNKSSSYSICLLLTLLYINMLNMLTPVYRQPSNSKAASTREFEPESREPGRGLFLLVT